MRRELLGIALVGSLAIARPTDGRVTRFHSAPPRPITIEQIIEPVLRTPPQHERTPIFMYHQVGKQEDRFTMRPARLRAHLDELCARGYEFQTFRQYARGEPTRHGGMPAVLTFDDSTQGQFRYLQDGRIDPSSAVGVL